MPLGGDSVTSLGFRNGLRSVKVTERPSQVLARTLRSFDLHSTGSSIGLDRGTRERVGGGLLRGANHGGSDCSS